MKDLSVKIKTSLFLLLLFCLILPFIQGKFKFIKLVPLQGAVTPMEKKYIGLHDWFAGDYQTQEEKYLNENFGFRSLFVRINNQIAFSLFGKARANSVIVGKKNYLFEGNYIDAYFGSDYIGEDSIEHRIQRLKFIQDTLAALNKNLIVIFAAGKGSFYPEYFPDKYRIKKTTTNYAKHVELAGKAGLRFIDFNKYFHENKYKSKYPLYPQYGIHWSYYGMCIVADSIINFIEDIRKIDMPDLYWDKIDLSDATGSDYDIADGMNILWKLSSFKMAYPVIQTQPDSGKVKPSLLVIADSYYWDMYRYGFTKVFSKNDFEFYNKQIYHDPNEPPIDVSDVRLKDEIDNHDIFIIMATEANLPGMGWGFIEDAYNLFSGK
jgi:hypothetical protein